MHPPFPFNNPSATITYILLYVITLSIHVIFMNYVLAGSLYMAAMALFPGRQSERYKSTTMQVIRDWMPFFVSAAITAGIAPLLFVQILYQKQFYTANLLLYHRWMIILPILIVGFYLTYLLKTKWIEKRGSWVRIVVAIGAVACFCYTAYAWSENYSMSVRTQTEWTEYFKTGPKALVDMTLLNRLSIWVAGAFPTMATLVAWQLWAYQRRGREVSRNEMRRLALVAIVGWGVAMILASIYFQSLSEFQQAMMAQKRDGIPYIIAAAVGGAASVIAWTIQWWQWRLRAACLIVASIGSVISIVSINLLRELLRSLQLTGFSNFTDTHTAYAKVGGLWVFLFFFILNFALIGLCFLIVKWGRKPAEPEPQVVKPA